VKLLVKKEGLKSNNYPWNKDVGGHFEMGKRK